METPQSTLILFGATGDLTAKKILPALDQWLEDADPYHTIWCVGRRSLDKEDYIRFIEAKGSIHLSEKLRSKIRYETLEFESPEDYSRLKAKMTEDLQSGITCYLAVKPEVFVTIASHLRDTELFIKGHPQYKLIFEKPFGKSLESARRTQADILKLAHEEQVYRIDHYLGKDMIRNILALRFGNRLFDESWNGKVLSTVTFISWEAEGVEERLDYYDKAGAINDMIQSHLLQLMALVAMEAPVNFESESIRKRKLDVLKQIVLSKNNEIRVGQYAGYREIGPAFAESTTETYVRVVLSIDHPEWRQTQFIMETGKKMREKRTEIVLEFWPNPLHISKSEQLLVEPNQIIIQIYPQEGVQFRFNSKSPGYGFQMEPVTVEYCHACRSIGNKPEAYVKLLMDAQAGDKTLFAGCEELELQWMIADKIREAASETDLFIYEEGKL